MVASDPSGFGQSFSRSWLPSKAVLLVTYPGGNPSPCHIALVIPRKIPVLVVVDQALCYPRILRHHRHPSWFLPTHKLGLMTVVTVVTVHPEHLRLRGRWFSTFCLGRTRFRFRHAEDLAPTAAICRRARAAI